MLYPKIFGELLAVHDRRTVCVGAGVPVPVAAAVVAEDWASLVNVRVALITPAACGLKVTVNGALCPAGMMVGTDNPPIVNCELFVLAAVTVTFAPLALRVPETVLLLPTCTVPRFSFVGLTAS